MMLQDWNKRFPGRIESMFRAMQNVTPSHLVDKNLHDFKAIKATGEAQPEGDIAFDAPEFEPESRPDTADSINIVNLTE
jgi:tRNA 2-thiocytidine biosynthesis protein TtcA